MRVLGGWGFVLRENVDELWRGVICVVHLEDCTTQTRTKRYWKSNMAFSLYDDHYGALFVQGNVP